MTRHTALNCHIAAIGLLAPGIDSWQSGREVLSGKQPYSPEPLPKKLEIPLTPAEKRRSSRVTQLALFAAQQALDSYRQTLPDNVSEEALKMASVFSSSDGDVVTFDQIARAVHLPGHPVSPIRFHNSVHNAPSGYWGIAQKDPSTSNSITAGDDSFAAGLLEAALQCQLEQRPVLLVGYDTLAPSPLDALEGFEHEMSLALVLTPQAYEASRTLRLSLQAKSEASRCDGELEALRLGNPQGRALPLLEAVANGLSSEISLNYYQQSLKLTLTD